MTFDLDILFMIFSFITIFFTFVYIVKNYDLSLGIYHNINISKAKDCYFKYTILNKLSTKNYDTYNKFRLWLYVVEF